MTEPSGNNVLTNVDECPRCGGVVGAETCEDCLWPGRPLCAGALCSFEAVCSVVQKDGSLRRLCAIHWPRLPEELLDAYLFEETLVRPDVSVPRVRAACQKAVLEHIQRCLILLGSLAESLDSWEDREEHERVAAEAYSALHGVEKDWLRRLGKPAGGAS